LGRGTERLEEHLAELLADARRPNGEPVRVARIDADTTRFKGELQSQLAAVHAGDVDVLVGTQMIAKGHDFRRITLVAAVNPDGALFSSDFRAPERLFSLLMQAAGRAGRDAALGERSEVWIQTFQPAHPLYAALKRHDYPGFAATAACKERQQANCHLLRPGPGARRGPHAGRGTGLSERRQRRSAERNGTVGRLGPTCWRRSRSTRQYP
jgi:primosomal protein N' (replication factor Y)